MFNFFKAINQSDIKKQGWALKKSGGNPSKISSCFA